MRRLSWRALLIASLARAAATREHTAGVGHTIINGTRWLTLGEREVRQLAACGEVSLSVLHSFKIRQSNH